MKSLLTLSILLALTLAKPPGRIPTSVHAGSPPVRSASSSASREVSRDIVREEFQVGRFFLGLGMRTEQNPAEDSASWTSRIGVNTAISTSLDPLSIRVIVVLNLETNQSADRNESALLRIPNAKSPPVWEGSIAGLISGC
jgi:hypothetical protein